MAKRPNFFLIVADDLGFSDVGAFGGEIHTPNLDALAASQAGVRLTNFHTASMCSPTRSMLLSGTDNYIAGLGQMEFRSRDLNPPMPWGNGYYTCMSGKWHLGLTRERAPHARGFDRSFALLSGGSAHYLYQPTHPDGTPVFAHWAPLYYEDDKQVDVKTLPQDYTSDSFVSRMAPQASIRKYRGIYNDGPDALRERRQQRQIELGLLPADAEAHPVVTDTIEWDDMTDVGQKWSSRTMEVFAGIVDRMDENIGRVIERIKSLGEWDNTFVLFMSDNGAERAVIEAIPMTGELDNLGNRDSFIWYGPRWAQTSTAPSRMHKGYVTEGGIRCPAIVHYRPLAAARTAGGEVTDAFATVMDILPTILDLAGVSHPGPTFRGREVVLVRAHRGFRI
ncbi:hypothetical protein Sste5346_007699 [Sporothrix stenoceras]|uniref:Sulfatase N-terminal domain-containing protein n=1 Tax=Sporothrix stenoceras TaxID=5173 RepID=A0ABR3YUC1_9PEZI